MFVGYQHTKYHTDGRKQQLHRYLLLEELHDFRKAPLSSRTIKHEATDKEEERHPELSEQLHEKKRMSIAYHVSKTEMRYV